MARSAILATLLVAAAALAACGGDNTEAQQYIRELTAAQTSFQREAVQLGAQPTKATTPRQDRRTLDNYAAAIADTIAALRRIDVPPEVVAEHRRLVDAFTTWHADFERFTAAIDKPTAAGLRRARRRIAAATVTFNESSRQAGIDIDAKLGT
jgi:ABC-type phosphate/phosphonate transport system substrate-binding protein